MRAQARKDIIEQIKIVASRSADLILLQDNWSTSLRDQKEQEIEEAKELLKVYQERYHALATNELTELYTKRKTLNVRIDALASYDLDLEEELMDTDSSIGYIEKEAESLGIKINLQMNF